MTREDVVQILNEEIDNHKIVDLLEQYLEDETNNANVISSLIDRVEELENESRG